MTDETNKRVRGYSLSPVNITWLTERALALSAAEKRMSDSEFLDNLITAAREKQQRAVRILREVEDAHKEKA